MTYLEILRAALERATEKASDAFHRAVAAENVWQGLRHEGDEYEKHAECLKAIIEEAEGLQ